MQSTLVIQLRRSLEDARRWDATSIAFEPPVVKAMLTALEGREEMINRQAQTILDLHDKNNALKRKVRGILNNDTATVLTKLQLLERAVSK